VGRIKVIRTVTAFAAVMAVAAPGIAQEDVRVPTVPAGTPAVLFPVQAVRPTTGGVWPGGGTTDRATLERLDAEIQFAFDEEPSAGNWALPDDVARRLRRNPMVKVDPYQLAYHGLVRKPKSTDQIYEPLHSQLRQVAALFNARIVVLPMLVWYEPGAPLEAKYEDDEEEEGRGSGDPSEDAEEKDAGSYGRAVMLTAIIDTRRSAVLWHGEIRGEPEDVRNGVLLSTLAFNTAHHLAP